MSQPQDRKDHDSKEAKSTEGITKVDNLVVSKPAHPLDDPNIVKNFVPDQKSTLDHLHNNSLDETERDRKN